MAEITLKPDLLKAFEGQPSEAVEEMVWGYLESCGGRDLKTIGARFDGGKVRHPSLRPEDAGPLNRYLRRRVPMPESTQTPGRGSEPWIRGRCICGEPFAVAEGKPYRCRCGSIMNYSQEAAATAAAESFGSPDTPLSSPLDDDPSPKRQ